MFQQFMHYTAKQNSVPPGFRSNTRTNRKTTRLQDRTKYTECNESRKESVPEKHQQNNRTFNAVVN